MEPEQAANLVRLAAAGDSGAWRTLVESYQGLVWSVARGFRLDRADAEDVAQITWEKLARSLGGLREPQWVGAWLATTARREAQRVHEVRIRTKPFSDLGWVASAWVDEESPERIVLGRQDEAGRAALARRAWQALRRLPDGCQQLLRVLMASPPPSYTEAAAALGRPIGYIGPTRRRCLDKLRELL